MDTSDDYLIGDLDDDAMDADAVAARAARAAPSAGLVDRIRVRELSARGRADHLTAALRAKAHADAAVVQALAEIHAHRPTDTDPDPTEEQVAALTGWPGPTAKKRLAEAARLTAVFPSTVQALSDALIRMEQASILADLTDELTRQAAQEVEARVLPLMPGWSLRKTREQVTRAVLQANPRAAADRHGKEVAQRHLEVRPLRHGMAMLAAIVSAEVAHNAFTRLTLDAEALENAPGETRTAQQLCPDLLIDRIHTTGDSTGEGRAAKRGRGRTEAVVLIPFESATGLADLPADLQGHGPIDAVHARQLCFQDNARWRLLITRDGVAMAACAKRYRPTQGLSWLARLLYRTCVFPNCTRPSEHCDLDHTVNFGQGGWTVLDNLAPLCRRHHRMKTRGIVTLQRLGGLLIWTLPDGQVLVTKPTCYTPLRT